MKKLITHIKLGEKTDGVSIIEVMHEGHWEHSVYGTVEITEQDIDKFVENFNKKVRKIDIAIDQEHEPTKGAAGWFKELKKVVENGITKLKATIEWTGLGKQLLNDGVYRYFSPEFDYNYEDPETHEVYENVLLGGGLTNRPYFKNLAPITMSENMQATITNYKEKGVKMTKEELKAKLAENSDFQLSEDASDDEKKLFEEVKAEIADKKAEKQEPGDDKKDTEIKGSENFISKSDHVKQMNELKSKMGNLEKKLKFKEVKETVNGFVFSESNPNGILLKKSKESARKILMSANPKTAKLFEEFLGTLPKISDKMFKEVGGADGKDNKGAKLMSEARKLMEDGKADTYSEAVKRVADENPELLK
ncbi:MAG: phage protease [Patescibacteria group bacterium]|nr:phage protease [Patescibacteria group bacterium]